MGTHFGWGIFLSLLGGMLNGSFYAPAKRMPLWRWENTWLVYSFTATLIIPWAFAFGAIPHLLQVYHETSWSVLLMTFVFGAGWGVGSVFFGLGVDMVGLALAYGVILGIIAIVGAAVPVLITDPSQFLTHQGIALLVGLGLVIVGTAFCAIAGGEREKDQLAGQAARPRTKFLLGFIVCVLAGVFSPLLNFAFIFGKDLQNRSLAAHAPFSLASYSIWALALTGGFCANAAYSTYLLVKNKTFPVFRASGAPKSYWLLGALMGFLWFSGIAAYGMGATELGSLGGVVCYPLFVATNIITGNVWGVVTGEWKGAGRRAYAYAYVGIAILVGAIFVIAHGSAS
jgi:L-rhamnose-H+ transport protein